MKSKQILLNVLAVVMAFEYIGVNMACVVDPSWGGLFLSVMSAMAFVVVFDKAYFYKYKH